MFLLIVIPRKINWNVYLVFNVVVGTGNNKIIDTDHKISEKIINDLRYI